jgi:hypothetical protein
MPPEAERACRRRRQDAFEALTKENVQWLLFLTGANTVYNCPNLLQKGIYAVVAITVK